MDIITNREGTETNWVQPVQPLKNETTVNPKLPIYTQDAKEKDLVSTRFELQAHENPYKALLQRVRSVPFATEYSSHRRADFEHWMNTHQQYLQDAFVEEGIANIPDVFVGIVHGSVARGHANIKSDTDGTIFFSISPPRAEFGKAGNLEFKLPKDWGVRFVNVQTLLIQLDELENEANEKASFFEKEKAFAYVLGPISHLFGPGTYSDEVEGRLDDWRKQVVQKIKNMHAVYPDELWQAIQGQWHTDFAVFDHRRDLQNVIENSLKQKGEPVEVLHDRANFIKNEQESLRLPDLATI
ncbi:hypothetical protein KAZ66_00845 [Candidatus Woesebacteria bacterium]|nr:hypothetical protein [Candidatus Woesebacteria bacterium]